MIITFYDLETTGFSVHQGDDVVQAALLDVNVDFDRRVCLPLKGRCMYFYHDKMRMSQGAYETHHISLDELKTHENEFYDNLCYMYSKLNYGNVCGFNNKRFDDPFIVEWMQQMNVPYPKLSRSYDMMKSLAGYMHKAYFKLVDAVAQIGQTPEVLTYLAEMAIDGTPKGAGAHCASYDVMSTYMLFNFALTNGYISKNG